MPEIAVHGPSRTGTTLLYNMAKAANPKVYVYKTHPAEGVSLARDAFYLLTMRDPRDVAVSRWACRLSRGPENDPYTGFEAELHEMERQYRVYEWQVQSLIGRNIFFRYEDFYKKPEETFNRVCGTKLKEGEFSLDWAKSVCSKLKDFNDVENATQLHGNHINFVEPGSGWGRVPSECLGMWKATCKPLCEKWGYTWH